VTRQRQVAAAGVLGLILLLMPVGEGEAASVAPMPGIAVAVAATPAPTEAVGGDTRSPQEGPGLVGNPVGAIAAVLGLGLLAVIGTTVYVRLTGDSHTRRR
jgi:hypothetical protein